MSENFPWFAARLLFEARVEDEGPALLEERIVVLHAVQGATAAERKAKKLGKAASDSYQNGAGDTVGWQFREVLEVVQLNDAIIEDGTEVYHHYLTAEEAEIVRQSLKSGSL